MLKRSLSALALTGALTGIAQGQCEGSGPILDVPTTIALGEEVTVCMHADAPAQFALLFGSLGDGPTDLGTYGTACLDFPVVFEELYSLDSNGDACFSFELCDPDLIDLVIYTQFISCGTGGRSSHRISNMVTLTIVDGIGAEHLCTHPQEHWNHECHMGGDAGCHLEEHFDHVFPGGIIIGDQDGNDADDCYAAQWTSAAAIQHFLTQPTRCAQLTGDHLNPKSESGFKFGAELLVAKLNVGFDDAGSFDHMKCRTDVKLGDLVFVACVDEDLIGWAVRDLIDFSDLAICGEIGAGPYDLDHDGKADVTCDDLMNALEILNLNFEGCEVDLGCLDLP